MLGVDDDGFRTAICFRSSTLTPRRLSAFVVCSPPTSSSSSELLVFASLFLFGLYLYSGHLLLCSSLTNLWIYILPLFNQSHRRQICHYSRALKNSSSSIPEVVLIDQLETVTELTASESLPTSNLWIPNHISKAH